MVGRWSLPFGKLTFRGRTVKLPGCVILKDSRKGNGKKTHHWCRSTASHDHHFLFGSFASWKCRILPCSTPVKHTPFSFSIFLSSQTCEVSKHIHKLNRPFSSLLTCAQSSFSKKLPQISNTNFLTEIFVFTSRIQQNNESWKHQQWPHYTPEDQRLEAHVIGRFPGAFRFSGFRWTTRLPKRHALHLGGKVGGMEGVDESIFGWMNPILLGGWSLG